MAIAEPTALSVLDNDRIQSISLTGAYARTVRWPVERPTAQSRANKALALFRRRLPVCRREPLAGRSARATFSWSSISASSTSASNLSAEVELGSNFSTVRDVSSQRACCGASVPADALLAPAAASALDQAFGQVGAELSPGPRARSLNLAGRRPLSRRRAIGG